MKQVSYIIRGHKGKYKPFISLYAPGCALLAQASGPTQEELEDAQEFQRKNTPSDVTAYPNPVDSNETNITWLSEIIAANPDSQTKEEADKQSAEENS